MAATIAGVSHSLTPRVLAMASSDTPNLQTIKSPWLNRTWKRPTQFLAGRMTVRPVAVGPDLSDKVVESIQKAEETCAGGDPASGECKAAWDEVEELSAAVSHAKEKKKESDPLEAYCQDNMEADECRTYED